MRTGWKKPIRGKNDALERRLIGAVDAKNQEEVTTLLDRLHRRGVHEGFAIEAARRFLAGGERR